MGILSAEPMTNNRLTEPAWTRGPFKKAILSSEPQSAEPLDDFIQRVGSAYQEAIERNSGSHFLIVAHAGVMRALIAKTVYAPPAGLYRIKISNGGITRIRHTETVGVLELLNGKLSG